VLQVLLAALLLLTADSTYAAEKCVDFEGLRFCVELTGIPSAGQRAKLKFATRNISSKPIIVFDMAKLPVKVRDRFVLAWDLAHEVKCESTLGEPVAPQTWYTSLLPGKSTGAEVASPCPAFAGDNELYFSIPYSWNVDSSASVAFLRSLWHPKQKNSPLIGPFKFTSTQ